MSGIAPQTNYPSLEQIADLVRSIVDDDKAGATGTPGEGQILTDTSVTLQNFMNSAIRETYRDIRIMGQPTLIKDNYILYGLPAVNSALGVGAVNPAVQVSLQFIGFFDGLEYNSNFTLPSDLILPLEMWERENGTNNPFGIMRQSTGALAPRYQANNLGEWEWRTDSIWMNGAVQSRDIRLRYVSTFIGIPAAEIVDDVSSWTNIYVPVMDSQEAISDKIAVRYARRLGSAQTPDLMMQADRSILRLRQQYTRTRQMTDFQLPSYGSGTASAAGSPTQTLY